MCIILIFAIIYYIIYRLYQRLFPLPNIDPAGKYVLISGCDTGFGHELAIEFDRQGFNVLAGVFLIDNILSLQNKLSQQATVFHLDITKQESIDQVFDLVTKKTDTLHALVNNAGISSNGYIDWIPLERMRQLMDVNYFGHVAMTKKFLPLLITKRNSRVVNVSSILGYMSLAGLSAYCPTKYALESFSDCLRREMFPWNLHVSIIEPGVMRTNVIKNIPDQIETVWNKLPRDVQQRWGEDFLNNLIKKESNNFMLINAENPRKVVEDIRHAVMNTEPRIRYRPGWQSKLIFTFFCIFPVWLHDIFLKIGLNSIPADVQNQLMN